MLVISRKSGEKLRIGDDVELVVLEISGSRVVIGIDAPREVTIRRLGSPHAESDSSDDIGSGSQHQADSVVAEDFLPADAHRLADPLPFEYPARAVEAGESRSARTPVITVRRSRKIVKTPPTGGH